MWNWLTRLFAQPRVRPQQIWLTSTARDGAIATAAVRAIAADQPVIVTACFQDRLTALTEAFAAAEIEYELWRPARSLAEIRRELAARRGTVLLTLDEFLPQPDTFRDDGARTVDLDDQLQTVILCSELHPLPQHDERLQAFADQLPAESCVVYLALDDAILSAFSSDKVQGMLKALGMTEEEAIESQIVSRQVTRARQRFADQAAGDAPASSAAQWLQTNLPTQ